MWRRGRNGANPGMVPPRGRGSDRRSRTHGRDSLSGGSDRIRHNDDNNGGYRSRHGGGSNGGCRSMHGGDSSGCRSSGGGSRATVGVVDRGRRRLPHSGPKVVSSARLHYGLVGEGEEMERMGEEEVS